MVDIEDKSLNGFTAYACFVIRDTSVKMKDAGHLRKISKIAGLFNELFTISEN